jgi:hypothetical protein
MVNVVDGFTQTTDVANGFSDLILSLYGSEVGMHARSAMVPPLLPSLIICIVRQQFLLSFLYMPM